MLEMAGTAFNPLAAVHDAAVAGRLPGKVVLVP
jgi:hypothetical protein